MINFEFIIVLALILAVVGILLSILSSFTESKVAIAVKAY